MAKPHTGYRGTDKKTGKMFVRFDYLDPATGRMRNKKKRVESITEGNIELRRMITEHQENGPTAPDADTLTVNSFLGQWLAAVKPKLAPRTAQDYKELIARYVEASPVGKAKLTRLNPLTIQNLYTDMLSRKGLSARTVRYLHAVLRSALGWGVKVKMLRINPASSLDLPKQTRREMKALSIEDANRFMAAAESDKFGLLFMLLLHTGARPEEILALQWCDVDFTNNKFMIQRAVVHNRKGGSFYFSAPKTAKGRRSIDVVEHLMLKLREHRNGQLEHRLKAGPAWSNPYDLVFPSDAGTPLMHQNLSRRYFKPLLKRAGLPESTRLYELRHSMASHWLAAGVHPLVVSERLGHASVVLTLDTYSHCTPNLQRESLDMVDKLLARK